MSQVQVDKIISKSGLRAPELTYGGEIPVGYGMTGAGGVNISGFATAGGFVGDITGDVTGNADTATTATNAQGLTGAPDVDLGNISAAGGDLTIRNITGVAATFTGAVSYEDVTNVDSTGIVTAGKGFRATTGGIVVTAGVSTLGVTSVTNFITGGTLVEGFSSTTTAYSSNGDLNISNGNLQFNSANLGGTNNTLNIMSTTGINTDVAINEAINVTAVTAVNAATAYVNKVTIDGVATGITTHWVGGSAPTDGGSSGLDSYSFNIFKTGNETYVIFANQTKTS